MARQQATAEHITAQAAYDASARVLRMAEDETNLALMERLECLGDSWRALGAAIADSP